MCLIPARLAAVILLAVLLASGAIMVSGRTSVSAQPALASPGTRVASYTPHAPITITSDAGFNATNGVTGGTGTATDPYVISGWYIVTVNTTAISITGTTAYFVIRDVFLNGTTYFAKGIWANTLHATVENSSFLGQGLAIIAVGPNFVIRDNRIVANGTAIVAGSNATITGNSISALDVNSSWSVGVDAYWAHNVTVTHNDFNHAIVYFRCTDGGVVADNVNVNGSNIFMASSRHVLLFHNTLLNSGGSDDMYYDDHGMGCWWAPGNNTWDAGYPSGGNYWSSFTGVDDCSGPSQNVCTGGDGIGDTPMPIYTFNKSAPGNFTDRYPLMQPARGPIPALFYTLYGSATAGWGRTATTITNPGPTLVGYAGVPVNLTLYSVDNTTHAWYLDLNGNQAIDPGEPLTPNFTWGDIVWFVFTPTQAGNFTYYCPFHPSAMHGTFEILPSIPSPPPPPAPIPSLHVTPTLGNLSTLFVANASRSSSGSPPTSLEYRWDWDGDGVWDTPWSSDPTSSHTFAAGGTYSVVVEVRNGYGGTAQAGETVQVDNEPPSTVANLAGTLGNRSWFRSAVTVTLIPSDDVSGIAATRFSVDGAAWSTYTAPVTISSDGIHTISFASTDVAGNAETRHTMTIKIDSSPPDVTITAPPSTTSSPLTITWLASDGVSGIDHYEVSADNSSFVDVGGALSLPLSLAPGYHEVRVLAVDLAGNAAMATQVFLIPGPAVTPAQGPSPLGLVLAAGLGIVGVAVAAAWYVTRRGRPRVPPEKKP